MLKLFKTLSAIAIGILEILLILRFIFKLLAASTRSDFVLSVYQATAPFVAPFRMAFPDPTVKGGFTLEFTTLFAIFFFAFIGYIAKEIIEVITKKSKQSNE